jgi:uncharacterized protein
VSLFGTGAKWLLSFALALDLSGVLAQTNGLDIAEAAKSQIGVTVAYDPSYETIAFPGGDVPRRRGVCTDVIIRALRDARGYDLQLEINKDMRAHRNAYPKKWGVVATKIDSNIDHRRVPNMMSFFERKGFSRPLTTDVSKYAPGDIVSWSLGGGLHHIGVVSDKKTVLGKPLIIHNIGTGAVEENILTDYRILGHYRLPKVLRAPSSKARRSEES